jgi:hypothetical protein
VFAALTPKLAATIMPQDVVIGWNNPVIASIAVFD